MLGQGATGDATPNTVHSGLVRDLPPDAENTGHYNVS